MEETPVEKTLDKVRSSNNLLLTLLILNLVIGLLGGLLGGYAYSQYRSGKSLFASVAPNVSNVSVNEDSAVIDVANRVSPAVVSITGTQSTPSFFGSITQSKSAGTGFIVSADGLIITNKHVVSDAGASYTVFTNDGKQYKATVKSTDPLNDIAFVKIDAKNLPTVTLGDSENLKIGQRVVAIGNALGQYQNSVTTGVVSAKGRAIQAGDSTGSTESLDNVIQTDAAINPGNSGGPLVNLEGQVIGINTAVDQQGQSIGFAIPINVAKSALASVISQGKVTRPMIGVRYIPITKEFASSNNLPVTEGAFIYGNQGSTPVVAGSPADRAGLQSGDIITKIGNDRITETQSLSTLLTKHNPGDKVQLTYIRDGKEKTVEIALAEAK